MSSTAFPIQQSSRMTFGTNARVITAGPSDLDPPAKAVVLTTAGTITIVPDSDDAPAITFTNCPVGFIPPFVVRRVTALTGGATAVTIDQ